ncbi:glutaredoxin family protein [Jeotgalibacillus proteolyticus]|uniref:NrdH-redoxin n=1 Tax=Jeotgalibacillus proteolyticus TaxID=2082395 RepID=A0A2S5GGY0_9BACL|nr:glutaredoxin domain-containing protein [Jeotgalibacillus proteolyticus]PPA72218.1 NrdH-redoxin [Jeotgalibacillus proteolyticus]
MHKVVLYTQPQCPPCEIVKKFLQAYEISFQEINIKKDENSKQYMINKLQSYSTPTIVVDNDHVIRGFNLDELAACLKIPCD